MSPEKSEKTDSLRAVSLGANPSQETQREIRRDSLGRVIHPNRLKNLRMFQPGKSGNPGGSYRRRTLADVILRQMKKSGIKRSDSLADLLNKLRES